MKRLRQSNKRGGKSDGNDVLVAISKDDGRGNQIASESCAFKKAKHPKLKASKNGMDMHLWGAAMRRHSRQPVPAVDDDGIDTEKDFVIVKNMTAFTEDTTSKTHGLENNPEKATHLPPKEDTYSEAEFQGLSYFEGLVLYLKCPMLFKNTTLPFVYLSPKIIRSLIHEFAPADYLDEDPLMHIRVHLIHLLRTTPCLVLKQFSRIYEYLQVAESILQEAFPKGSQVPALKKLHLSELDSDFFLNILLHITGFHLTHLRMTYMDASLKDHLQYPYLLERLSCINQLQSLELEHCHLDGSVYTSLLYGNVLCTKLVLKRLFLEELVLRSLCFSAQSMKFLQTCTFSHVLFFSTTSLCLQNGLEFLCALVGNKKHLKKLHLPQSILQYVCAVPEEHSKAVEVLCQHFKSLCTLEELDVSCNAFGDSSTGSRMLIALLSNKPRLQRLYCSGNSLHCFDWRTKNLKNNFSTGIAAKNSLGRHTECLASFAEKDKVHSFYQSLREFKNLKICDLSSNFSQKTSTKAGQDVLCAILHEKMDMKVLDLSSNDLTSFGRLPSFQEQEQNQAEESKLPFDSTTCCHPCNSRDLPSDQASSSNHIGDDSFAICIENKASPAKKEENRRKCPNGVLVAESLRYMNQLTECNFSFVTLDSQVEFILESILYGKPRLKRLLLRNTSCSKFKNLKWLKQSLEEMSELEKISFSFSATSKVDKSAREFLTALLHNKLNVRNLTLPSCRLDEFEEGSLLESLKVSLNQMSSLQECDVYGNNLGGTTSGRQLLKSILSSKFELTTLDISDNNLSEYKNIASEQESLSSHLRKLPLLETCHVEGNDLGNSSQGRELLLSLVSDKLHMQTLALTDNALQGQNETYYRSLLKEIAVMKAVKHFNFADNWLKRTPCGFEIVIPLLQLKQFGSKANSSADGRPT